MEIECLRVCYILLCSFVVLCGDVVHHIVDNLLDLVRLVNIESDKIQQVINNIMNYITEEDYEAAKKYVANPEAYDFRKILNW